MNREFVGELRRSSVYPTFRAILGVFVAIGYLAAVAIAAYGATSGVQAGNYAVLFVGVLVAVFVAIVVALVKELASMVADIADAVLHMASAPREAEHAKANGNNFVSPTDLANLARGGRP